MGCFQAFKTQNRWFSVVLAGWGRGGEGEYKVGRLLEGWGPRLEPGPAA